MMCCKLLYMFGFFSKQKTAYEMRISDCSSDVCSSDLKEIEPRRAKTYLITKGRSCPLCGAPHSGDHDAEYHGNLTEQHVRPLHVPASDFPCAHRSEEHTSELQSLMRISYAVFCLKKKKNKNISLTSKQNSPHKRTNTSHNYNTTKQKRQTTR